MARAYYKGGLIKTIFTTEDPAIKTKGFTLKNGGWSPYMINLREIGGLPKVFEATTQAMADLFEAESGDINHLVGIDMNGIPLGSSTFYELLRRDYDIKYGYTRPMAQKIRTLEDWLKQTDAWGHGYGIHKLVEALFCNNDICATFDDIATNLSSKLVARLMVLSEAELRGIDITCNDTFYVIDRNDNAQAGIAYAKMVDYRLKPAPQHIHRLMLFNDILPSLKDLMTPQEYQVIKTYQHDPKRYGADIEWISQALQLAAETASC